MSLDPSRLVVMAATVFCINTMCCAQTLAAVEYVESSSLSQKLHLPVSEWTDPDASRRVVVLALHGFMLHGGKFDNLARHLVAHGAIVFAPDLRGFGRWYFAADNWPGGSLIDYKQSKKDALALLKEFRSAYPDLPIVCLGESMGANLSVRLGAEHPELVNGLILSSPCVIKRRTLLHFRVIVDAVVGMLCPRHQVNLVPYAEKYISEDSLNDPLVRKQAGAWEILRTLRGLNTSLHKASLVDYKIQVLVLRGSNDKLCKYDAVAHLANRLASSCKVLHCVADQGHLLLEDPESGKESESLIDDWLDGKFCRNRDTGDKMVEQIDNENRR